MQPLTYSHVLPLVYHDGLQLGFMSIPRELHERCLGAGCIGIIRSREVKEGDGVVKDVVDAEDQVDAAD